VINSDDTLSDINSESPSSSRYFLRDFRDLQTFF